MGRLRPLLTTPSVNSPHPELYSVVRPDAAQRWSIKHQNWTPVHRAGSSELSPQAATDSLVFRMAPEPRWPLRRPGKPQNRPGRGRQKRKTAPADGSCTGRWSTAPKASSWRTGCPGAVSFAPGIPRAWPHVGTLPSCVAPT